MKNETWLQKFEREITRKVKVKNELRNEVDDKINQLRLLEEEIQNTIDDFLSTGQPSQGDIEWDLLDERINGGK
jgi:phage portal protein BeeE